MPIKTARQNVDLANKLTSKDILRLSYGHNAEKGEFESKGQSFICQAYQPKELEENDRKVLMHIFEENMKTMYEETPGGWNAESKEDELFDDQSRFLLIRQYDDKVHAEIIAFIMWRFDQEPCETDDPVARKGKQTIEVAYCYEIQVHSNYRQFGLGKWMMKRLETIAQNTNMRKIMLTVFKSNANARQFYNRLGFKVEYSTPLNAKEEQLDELGEYVILAKATI